jgi:hypothetical protein
MVHNPWEGNTRRLVKKLPASLPSVGAGVLGLSPFLFQTVLNNLIIILFK